MLANNGTLDYWAFPNCPRRPLLPLRIACAPFWPAAIPALPGPGRSADGTATPEEYGLKASWTGCFLVSDPCKAMLTYPYFLSKEDGKFGKNGKVDIYFK